MAKKKVRDPHRFSTYFGIPQETLTGRGSFAPILNADTPRAAQQAGDRAQVRKWVWSVRVLRMAASEWRRRAQRIAPVLVCLFWLAGCATPAALRVTDAVSLPHALVSKACEESYTRNIVTFQDAEVLFNGDVPWALDRDLYDFGFSDHRRVLVDFRQSTERDLLWSRCAIRA